LDADLFRLSLYLAENHSFVDIFFHKFGNIVIIQNSTNITQEKIFQTIGSTHIKIVDAFNNKENITLNY
jgi:hypothetical protein